MEAVFVFTVRIGPYKYIAGVTQKNIYIEGYNPRNHLQTWKTNF